MFCQVLILIRYLRQLMFQSPSIILYEVYSSFMYHPNDHVIHDLNKNSYVYPHDKHNNFYILKFCEHLSEVFKNLQNTKHVFKALICQINISSYTFVLKSSWILYSGISSPMPSSEYAYGQSQ